VVYGMPTTAEKRAAMRILPLHETGESVAGSIRKPNVSYPRLLWPG